LVVVIFRNEVNCRGGEEEKLIWPGEEEEEEDSTN